jgi:hypothetical protein
MRRSDRPRTRFGIPIEFLERHKLSVVLVLMKRDEINWLEDEAERREMKHWEFMGLVLQLFLNDTPERLPADREVLTPDSGLGKDVLVNEDTLVDIQAECQRLGTDESDLIRYALLRLRDGEPV